MTQQRQQTIVDSNEQILTMENIGLLYCIVVLRPL